VRGWGPDGLGTGAQGRGCEGAESVDVDYALKPSEVAALFPKTLGSYFLPPPGTTFGKSLEHRPKSECKDVGNGVKFWQAPWDPPAAGAYSGGHTSGIVSRVLRRYTPKSFRSTVTTR
jgi:hypothetical protein